MLNDLNLIHRHYVADKLQCCRTILFHKLALLNKLQLSGELLIKNHNSRLIFFDESILSIQNGSILRARATYFGH